MIPSLDEFFDNLKNEMLKANITVKPAWFIDHVCYRTATKNEYLELCAEYSLKGDLLIEAPVGGRLISTFKLYTPLIFGSHNIPLIEIPMPKAGRVTKTGYEHIEIVIQDSFEEIQKEYSHLNFLTHAQSKKINPEIEVELNNCSIKFHHKSLEDVIEFEKSIGVV